MNTQGISGNGNNGHVNICLDERSRLVQSQQSQNATTGIYLSTVAAATPQIAGSLAFTHVIIPIDSLTSFASFSGSKTKKYDDGSIYVGEMNGDIPHGRGVLTYSSNDNCNRKKYEGEFINGVKAGQGTMTWNDGQKYMGEWVNDNMDGLGTYSYKSGNIYQGPFKKNKAEGQGKLIYLSGDIYVGSYKNDQRNGPGKLQCINGDSYDEYYLNDKLHGNRTRHYRNGATSHYTYSNGEDTTCCVIL